MNRNRRGRGSAATTATTSNNNSSRKIDNSQISAIREKINSTNTFVPSSRVGFQTSEGKNYFVPDSKEMNPTSDTLLINFLTALKDNVDAADEKLSTIFQQIIMGDWYLRSKGVVSQIESLLTELLVLRPSLVSVVIKAFVSRLCPLMDQGLVMPSSKPEEISAEESKIFTTCHLNLERVFKTFPSKRSNGVKAMDQHYPYMTIPTRVHYHYVSNLFSSLGYLAEVKSQVLGVIIHKLIRIDVNIPRGDVESLSQHQGSLSMVIKKEDGGQEIFPMSLDDGSFTENPLIQTLDLCLDIVFQYIDSIFSSTASTVNSTSETENDVPNLLSSFLQIFESEILPTFNLNNVQFLYFYIASLQPSFLSSFLDFLWRQAINMNTPPVLRIQAMSYLSGILSRAQFINIKVVKKWLTRMSEYANDYAGQRAKSCHWSSVNIEAHGSFYAMCQSIFYIFAFRNKELITSRKCLTFTRTLDLGRLVTSELNPLKACEDQIATCFVEAAHQHQISYCRTVLERNQTATIPTISREMITSTSAEESFALHHLESFFPFDPLLLPKCKKWIDGIYKTYEQYEEEISRRTDDTSGRRDETEDTIEMELGSLNNSFKTTDFYCNGSTPFKVKCEVKQELLEGLID